MPKLRDSFSDVAVFVLYTVAAAVFTVGILTGNAITKGHFETAIRELEAKYFTAIADKVKAEDEKEKRQGEGGFIVRVIEGRASYYGKESGNITSTQEPFDGTSWTAAHRTIPPGTLLIVESLDTGKWAVVRVNDFGPHRRLKDREIDLSKRVAEHLGMIERGLARVRLYELTLRPRPSEGD